MSTVDLAALVTVEYELADGAISIFKKRVTLIRSGHVFDLTDATCSTINLDWLSVVAVVQALADQAKLFDSHD